jgi:yecA family protein
MSETPLNVENAQRLAELLAILAHAADEDAPAVTLDSLDGYMTALLAGPLPTAPIQAMDALFGEDWPAALEEQDQTEPFMDALHLRWNEIADSLDPQALIEAPEQMHLNPLISEFDEETKAQLLASGQLSADLLERLPATGALWAQGFLQAVRDSESWMSADAGAAQDLTLMLQAIAAVGLEEGSSQRAQYIAEAYEEPEEIDQNALIDDALFTVQDLRLFWLQQAALQEAAGGDEPA